MKLFRTVALGLATAAALLSGTAFAQTNPTFNVGITLTPKCYVNMTTPTPGHGTVSDVALVYESFQEADEEKATSFAVRCTNTYPYGVSVTPATGTVAGINYNLNLVESATPAYATPGVTSLTGLSGSGTGKTYSVGAHAAGGQAGTCAATPCTGSQQHTITVSY
jgi:hypothetical protein